ncbi:MAG: aminodeoxychorismate synthase component I [Saprospiraceae bacterium]
MSSQEHAIIQMNELGKRGVPFLFMVDFLMQNPLIQPLSAVNPQALLYSVNGFKNYQPPKVLSKPFFFKKYPLTFAEYLPKFNTVKQHIQAGNSFLVNLTCPTPIETNITLKEIFLRSEARYKIWWRDHFVCFSPEIFVQIRQGKIASFPMKGTIDAAVPDAAQVILSDPKETAEHHTIVDLIRNDLSIITKNVEVERLRYVEQVRTNGKHLLQVSSKIVGELPPNFAENLGDVIFQLLPAGSISGAPKPKTLDIIREAEQYERGFYTGIFGIFDGANVDCGVLIRFIEQTPNGLIYKSGGGITAFSEAEKEYQEMIDKVYLPFEKSPRSNTSIKTNSGAKVF